MSQLYDTNPLSHEALASRLIQLTRDLVLIESTDNKPEERKRCFQFARNHLEGLTSLDINMYSQNGYDSLIATPKGIDNPEFLFCAHLDVVQHPSSEFYRSKIEQGRIYGPGTGDMKGALAIAFVLLRELHKQRSDYSIGLAITSDEERGGENGTRFLLDEVGLRCGSAIIPDGGSIDRITVDEKGILHLRLISTGHSAHAARPWLGDNPLTRLMKALQRLDTEIGRMEPTPHENGTIEDDGPWQPTISITRVDTPNRSANRIPDDATAVLDIRFPPPHTADSMIAFIKELLPDQVELEVIIAADPTHLYPDPDFLESTKRILEREPKLLRAAAGSDARFFRQHNIPVLLSRPEVGNLHSHDEWIDIQSMIDYYRICEHYLKSKLQ